MSVRTFLPRALQLLLVHGTALLGPNKIPWIKLTKLFDSAVQATRLGYVAYCCKQTCPSDKNSS